MDEQEIKDVYIAIEEGRITTETTKEKQELEVYTALTIDLDAALVLEIREVLHRVESALLGIIKSQHTIAGQTRRKVADLIAKLDKRMEIDE